MPKIPQFEQTPQTQAPAVPGMGQIFPTKFGTQWDALAGAAGAGTNLAVSLAEKRKEAQDQDYAFNTAISDKQALVQYQQDLQTKMPPNYQGYTQAVQQFVQNRAQQGMDNAPSGTAQNLYQHAIGEHFGSAISQASITENTNKAKSYQDDMMNSYGKSASLLVNNPDMKTAYDLSLMHEQQIRAGTGTIVSEDQADTLAASKDHALAKGYLDGLYAKGLGNTQNGQTFLKQGLSFLQGKDRLSQKAGDNSLLNGLEEPEKAAYLDRFTRALDQQRQINTTAILSKVNDDTFALLNGKISDPTQTIANIRSLQAQGGIQPDKASHAIDDTLSAYATGQVLNQMKTTSPSQWASIQSSWDQRRQGLVQALVDKMPGMKAALDPNFNGSNRASYQSTIASEKNQILKERMGDGATAVSQSYPGVAQKMAAAGNDPGATQDALKDLLSAQSTLGIPTSEQRYTTKPQASQMAYAMMSATPEQKSNQLAQIQNQYGPYAEGVFNEMAEVQGFDKRLWASSYIQDPTTRKQAIDNIDNHETIEKAFKESGKASADELTKAIKAKMDPWYSSMAGSTADPSGLERPNAIKQLVELEAKRLIGAKQAGSADAAITQAMSLVKQNFIPIQAANSNVVIPRQGNREDIVRGFMEAGLAPESLKDMNLKQPSADKNMSEQEYYQELSKNARWYSPGGNELRLQYVLPDGSAFPVRTKSGGQVVFDAGNVSRGNIDPALYQRALNRANEGTVHKLWRKLAD